MPMFNFYFICVCTDLVGTGTSVLRFISVIWYSERNIYQIQSVLVLILIFKSNYIELSDKTELTYYFYLYFNTKCRVCSASSRLSF